MGGSVKRLSRSRSRETCTNRVDVFCVRRRIGYNGYLILPFFNNKERHFLLKGLAANGILSRGRHGAYNTVTTNAVENR